MPARFAPVHDDDDTPLQKVTGGEFVLLTTFTNDEALLNEMHSRFTQLITELRDYAQREMYMLFPSQATIQYKVTRIDNYEKTQWQG